MDIYYKLINYITSSLYDREYIIYTNNIKYNIKKQKDNPFECPICYENEKSIALIGCGHTFCNRCKDNLSYCPVCRNRVTGYIRIYL